MEPYPLVGAEVQRVRSAFAAASRELTAALAACTDLDVASLGASSDGSTVEAAVQDLRDALGQLRATGEESADVAARHLGGVER